MERRYEILLDNKARDIKSFNQRNGDRMPYILIVIDELADLMVSYGREVKALLFGSPRCLALSEFILSFLLSVRQLK